MQETKSSLFHRMNELKTDKLKMLVAFGKAQADKKLERVTWQDSQGTTYTANLEKANLNIIASDFLRKLNDGPPQWFIKNH